MMSEPYFSSDPHFGHPGMVTFTNDAGQVIRPFKTIEEHDEELIARWNAKVPAKARVYVLGDVAMSRRHIATISRCNGRKVLLKGNHDIFPLKDYLPHFDDIRSYKIYPEHGIVCSHIPVHPDQLEGRFKVNVHGHKHDNEIMLDVKVGEMKPFKDTRYINVCMERTNYTPVSFTEILEMMK